MKTNQTFERRFLYLLLAGTVAVFALILVGGVVRAAGAGGACLDWPTCFGAWTPPAEFAARLDYLHRLATALAALPVVGAAVWAWRRYRAERLVSRALFGAAGLLLAQVGLGAAVAFQAAAGEGPGLGAVHLALSLLLFSALVTATVGAFYRVYGRAPRRLRFESPFARLSLVTFAAVFVLLISGSVVAATGASAACSGWPLCAGGLLPTTLAGWINMLHRLVVAGTALLAAALFVQAWRTQRSQPAVLTATTAVFVLFVSQALLGAQLVQGFPPYLLVVHQATAVAVWGALTVQLVAAGLAQRSAEEEAAEAAEFAARRPGRMAKDLLLLTKPIVVALLLVTTYAGMVIGAEAWPPLALTFWTLAGGFLAAGGSGAINQYIDRFDDTRMQRTQNRPLPAGRLQPAEGLAFGVGVALLSFFLLTAFVNFLAALLSLVGIIYYVLIYSIWLKKITVQNIVIGGGAGAIPPLVGWAAATGSLNVPSLLLFAVIFMWTPPHFWALALVRRNDYARAGVPMLPVVRGERETRWQIFLYTLELVGLTLLLPLFGLGGAVYLAGAAVLGLWLISAAYRVWKGSGNKVAWKMYRYSSMYLAFLFFVLMADALL